MKTIEVYIPIEVGSGELPKKKGLYIAQRNEGSFSELYWSGKAWKQWENRPDEKDYKDVIVWLKKTTLTVEGYSVEQVKILELFREVMMRSQIYFPETEQDLDWFNDGIIGQRNLFVEVGELLGIGKLNEGDEIK